jgi:hypothetical protein
MGVNLLIQEAYIITLAGHYARNCRNKKVNTMYHPSSLEGDIHETNIRK